MLPLLRDALVPGRWLSDNAFLAGYGAAQAIPGPLFTFAAYLGAVVAPGGTGALWATVAVVFMFLPGLLVALAGLPLWSWFGHHPVARAALVGINGKRGSVALLPLGRADVLGRPGYGVFELSLWLTLPTTRRVSSGGSSC